ncbi:MAG TPA: tetratricopeptide repeat protein [Steroidobacteraceae bacterium]|nr:tetratricopeptide repeat protein [Steroidobacteraceae bacterium]
MRTRALLILGSILLLAAPLAWSIPGTPDDAGGDGSAPAPSAQDIAVYRDALALMKRGDDSAGPGAAHEAYAGARAKLQSLLGRSPQFAEAWNALGYTQRQLGANADALASYARALELKPGYPEALEYRGEAFLRLNRLREAKQAYLDLFATNRTIAATLLQSMKAWIGAREAAHQVDAGVTDLKQWVQERSVIATQTAALTRAGTAAGWR